MKHRIRLISFAPLFGQGGDAINEGQLINALSKYVESIYCFTFVSFFRIFLDKSLKAPFSFNKNVKLITLPGFPLPYIFVFVELLYHMLIGLIYILIERIIKPNITYIRGRLTAFSLLTLKPFISRPVVVKFDNFAADDVLPLLKQKQLKGVIGKLLWVVDHYTLRRADLLLVNSDVMRSLIMEKSSIEGHKIIVCPPGIDVKKIEMIKKSGAPSVREGVRVGFIGSLTWWQGVDLLAQAVCTVKKKIPNIELFIIGNGPLWGKIISICEENNIKYTITGFVSHDEALNYLKNLDVLVVPRLRTPATESNIPIKIIEAWALGIPVIVTSHKVLIEAGYKDREHLLYCTPHPLSICEALLSLLENENLRGKLIASGPILAEKYSYDEIAKKLLLLIMDRINKSKHYNVKRPYVRRTSDHAS